MKSMVGSNGVERLPVDSSGEKVKRHPTPPLFILPVKTFRRGVKKFLVVLLGGFCWTSIVDGLWEKIDVGSGPFVERSQWTDYGKEPT